MNTPHNTPSHPTKEHIYRIVADAKAARGREFVRLFRTLTAGFARPARTDFTPGMYAAKLGTTNRYSSAYF
jgi:hypothetical protein